MASGSHLREVIHCACVVFFKHCKPHLGVIVNPESSTIHVVMAWKSDTEIFGNSSVTDGKASSLLLGICGLVLFPVILVILFLMLFMYKTYKTTFQRLIIYYIVLSLYLDFSAVVLIVEAFTDTDGKWICIVQEYLLISSQFAWYTYITAIVNFSLLFTICLTRGRGAPLSKRSSRCVECICILSAVTTGLTMASLEQIYSHIHGIKCTVMNTNSLFLARFWGTSLSIFFAMDLEVILASISLCIISCVIRQRIRNRQTAVLLRNSVIHIAINATIMGLDCFRMGYNVYAWSSINYSREFSVNPTIVVIFLVWYVIFWLAIGISVITQAVLCIQSSTQGNPCCKRCCVMNQSQRYAAIDGNDNAATNPASSRVSQPSYTNFAIPYTGEFTQITASANFDDGDQESEQRPLIEYD